MPTTHVTLQYTANPSGQWTAAQLAGAMSGVAVPQWVGPLTGAVVSSDVSHVVGGQAVRTIVFDVTSATFQRRFATSPLAPFWGIMTATLRAAINQPVLESAPLAS